MAKDPVDKPSAREEATMQPNENKPPKKASKRAATRKKASPAPRKASPAKSTAEAVEKKVAQPSADAAENSGKDPKSAAAAKSGKKAKPSEAPAAVTQSAPAASITDTAFTAEPSPQTSTATSEPEVSTVQQPETAAPAQEAPAAEAKPAAGQKPSEAPPKGPPAEKRSNAKPAGKPALAQTPPPAAKASEPMNKALLYGAAVLALLVLLIVVASIRNSGQYTVADLGDALEIRQGLFAPMGQQHLITIPDVQPPSENKTSYSRSEIYPLICEYYLKQADELMIAPGAPDFDAIKDRLNLALGYAVNSSDRSSIRFRLRAIDRTVLLYKAEVAASKGSLKDFWEAKTYLEKAASLEPDAIEAVHIRQRLEFVDRQMELIKSGTPSSAGGTAKPSSVLPEQGAGKDAQSPPAETTAPGPGTT
jgi:chemotaxis protein histidine kinase CheA